MTMERENDIGAEAQAVEQCADCQLEITDLNRDERIPSLCQSCALQYTALPEPEEAEA